MLVEQVELTNELMRKNQLREEAVILQSNVPRNYKHILNEARNSAEMLKNNNQNSLIHVKFKTTAEKQ